jgi:short-subunit dehydrogenase
VEGFTESLSYELSSLGIQVKLIEPGIIVTDFHGRSMVFGAKERPSAYDEPFAKWKANRGGFWTACSTPEQLAEAIYGAATDGKAQLRYLVGPDAEKQVGLRKAQGDEAYVAALTQQALS